MMRLVAQEKQLGRKKPLKHTPVVASLVNLRSTLKEKSRGSLRVLRTRRGWEVMRSIPGSDGGVG